MELIEKQLAINAFMTATSDGDKADWCVDILKSLPTVQYDPEWHECFDEDLNSFPDDSRNVLVSFSNF